MKDFLLENGFNEVAPNHFLRSPLRVNITDSDFILWVGSKPKITNEQAIKEVILSTEFRTKVKNDKN